MKYKVETLKLRISPALIQPKHKRLNPTCFIICKRHEFVTLIMIQIPIQSLGSCVSSFRKQIDPENQFYPWLKTAGSQPPKLELAHKKLDEAVFAAYGWKSDLTDEEILERLLSLNLERAK
ncbi:MAG: hypothetical protein HGA79_05485 [Anaerolineales bacterium]|nr:hypothetical protein [Anaerolineales bacterium]